MVVVGSELDPELKLRLGGGRGLQGDVGGMEGKRALALESSHSKKDHRLSGIQQDLRKGFSQPSQYSPSTLCQLPLWEPQHRERAGDKS